VQLFVIKLRSCGCLEDGISVVLCIINECQLVVAEDISAEFFRKTYCFDDTDAEVELFSTDFLKIIVIVQS
jgi:hypothetical protein